MVKPLGSYTIYEFSIYPVNGMHKCLDASTSSPYKGVAGDPAQLYSCFNDYINNANQWWNPINTTGDYVELQSWAFPDLRLAAVSTYQAELAECGDNSPSMFWDWYHFRGAVGTAGSGDYGELSSYQTDYSLAAYDTGTNNPAQNGDPVLALTTYSGLGYENGLTDAGTRRTSMSGAAWQRIPGPLNPSDHTNHRHGGLDHYS
jgi:hypothetical protein